ncbi:unnamed protein product [Somion occarium]
MSSSHPNIPFASSSSFIPPTGHIRTAHFLDESGSPPPYSPTPPEPPECLQSSSTNSASPFLAKRAASTPHLHSPPLSPSFPAHPHSIESSRRPSTSTLHARRARHAYETSDDPDTDASMSEDTVIYTSTQPSLAGTLRARLFGKGKGRADFEERMRPISTTPGVLGAGETETEGEDSSPRHLPTARITSSSTSNSSTFLSTLTTDASAILPSPPRSLIPILFELSRLLSIVPAVFGTLYNIYHIVRPPDRGNWTRAEYFVSALWSILTGWQCLQLTTGLLKRWRVYYSPLPTLIRLLALQAICWPATHLTLTFLEHEKRPLVCWAVIATTTCCSRSIQMWVTSNIIVFPHPHHHSHHGSPSHTASSSPLRDRDRDRERDRDVGNRGRDSGEVGKEKMKMSRRRKWDWGAVGVKCALPAGMIYFLMAWVEILRREFESRSSPTISC